MFRLDYTKNNIHTYNTEQTVILLYVMHTSETDDGAIEEAIFLEANSILLLFYQLEHRVHFIVNILCILYASVIIIFSNY